jgi:type IV secretory pathway TraG/TraD family ATPase VirD4
MMSPSERRDEALAFAILAILWVLGTMALLGPVALVIAGVTMIGAFVMSWHIRGGLIIAVVGIGLGSMLWGFEGWLTGPTSTMVEIYREYLFDGQRWDFIGLRALFVQMLMDGPAWPYFAPLGIAAGGLYFTTYHVCMGSQLQRTTQAKSRGRSGPGFITKIAKRRADQADAEIGEGTLIGIDMESRKRVQLSDKDANTHTLVLGTTGSGKTVTLLNIVESAINRRLPVIYVDGKGDYGLARKVIGYASAQGRPAYLFAMNGDSCVYNPMVSGGFSAKKDRIIELREWSEDHYRKLSEGYMQMVFKVLEACGVTTDLLSVADYMSTARLTELIERRGNALDHRQHLLAMIKKREPTEQHVQSLLEEVWTLAESEIGHLLDTAGHDPAHVLDLVTAIEQRAVVYFCLPALQFPALAKLVGKLVVNDLKSAAATQIAKAESERMPLYAILDEFSVFAGEQVYNLINQGRSAGVHAILATQSVADIGRAVIDGPDHFIRQVFANCNNYLIQRLNAAEDVTAMVEMIGTEDAVEHTAQVDLLGSTGMGSARRTKTFTVHPDVIKRLTMGEAMFINKNRNLVQHILVRRGQIDRGD